MEVGEKTSASLEGADCGNGDKSTRLIGRNWIACCSDASATAGDVAKTDCSCKFRMATYNILTDKAVRSSKYLYCPEEVRYMSARHLMIMSEVKDMAPDIICFQEVDYENYKTRLQTSMRSMGYQGILLQRKDDCGMATFWKDSSFQLLDQKHSILHHLAETYLQMADLTPSERQLLRQSMEAPQAVLLVRLRHVTSDSQLAVANIHVTWSELKFPALQVLQISMGARELSEFVRGLRCAQIFCGDFNSPPDSLPYHLLSSGQLDDVILDCLKKNNTDVADEVDRLRAVGLLDVLPKATFTIRNLLKSAYKSVLGSEPAITNCDDACQDYLCKLCLDYIWFTPDSLHVTGVLETPPSESFTKHHALPSVDFPSDHIPILGEFAFK